MAEFAVYIHRFIDHFKEQRRAIAALPQQPYVRQFQKSLYVSVLDSLARCVHPRWGNRDRFTRFVARFGAWPHHERVSLPHLAGLLARVPDPEFSELRAFVRNELKAWFPGSIILIGRDPELSHVLKLWPSAGEHKRPLESVSAESLQHFHLLYTYRNSLLHEFRQPSNSYELGDNPDPHYMNQLPDPEAHPAKASVWVLYYPLQFFEALVDSALSNLHTYLLEHAINPYDSYVFGDYWVEPLNR